MENVDVHPPFRSLLKHKAFLCQWVADHMHDARHGLAFMNEDISIEMHKHFLLLVNRYDLRANREPNANIVQHPIFFSRKFVSAAFFLTAISSAATDAAFS